MKILIISLYDFPYGKSIGIFEDGKLTPLTISNNMWYTIRDSKWTWSESENAADIKRRMNDLIAPYDHAILCEDGTIEVLK